MKTKLLPHYLQNLIWSVMKPATAGLLLILALRPEPCALSQIPQGFNYQALALDGTGNAIKNYTTLQVKISILSDTIIPVVVWEELHNPVKTDRFGVFNLVIGNGARQSGSALTFSDIDWTKTPLYINTQIYYPNSWKNMGSAKLWSVPYSMVAGTLDGSINSLKVVSGADVTSDSALFEVRRKDGQIMFAVYNQGVRVYMPLDTLSKGRKGGFAIGGFSNAKGTIIQDYFVVSPDSIRAYVDNNPTKSKKGGFAIGGFDKTKRPIVPFVDLRPKNYFIGQEAGLGITTGLYNSFIGYQAGKSNKDGDYNIFIGYQTGFNTLGPSGAVGGSEGSYNSFVGYQAGYSNLYGAHNTALGYSAGYNNTSDKNTFLGSMSGFSNTSGYSNTFIGTQTGSQNTTGSFNVFLGRDAGNNVITGNWNTLIGSGAGANIGTGDKNIVIGSGAMGENYFAGSGTGSSNIMIGFEAGYSASNSSSNIFIGNQAGYDETGSNLLVIQNNSSSTPLIYGNFGTNIFRVNGNIEATGTIGSVSDVSLKQNIIELTNVTERLDQIRGVYFYWIHSGNIGLLLPEGRQIGVIAQEVEKVFPELVITNDKGYKMVDYAKLTPVLLEAIKEQKKQIESQQKEIDELKTLVNTLVANQTGQGNK